jgi:hypothetical protein
MSTGHKISLIKEEDGGWSAIDRKARRCECVGLRCCPNR